MGVIDCIGLFILATTADRFMGVSNDQLRQIRVAFLSSCFVTAAALIAFWRSRLYLKHDFMRYIQFIGGRVRSEGRIVVGGIEQHRDRSLFRSAFYGLLAISKI